MYCDFKETMWERVEIPDEIAEEFLLAMKKGEIKSVNDVFDLFPSQEFSCEQLLDTSEQMSIEENGMQSTIEVYDIVEPNIYHIAQVIYDNATQ